MVRWTAELDRVVSHLSPYVCEIDCIPSQLLYKVVEVSGKTNPDFQAISDSWRK
jgi:hypothetical protein